MANKKKKKRTSARERDWTTKHETAFSHDLVKHRRAVATVTDAAPQAPLPESFAPNAVVVAHAKKWAFVTREGGELLCKIDERLVAHRQSLLAPGDRVLIEPEGEHWVVRGIAPRRTWLSRPALHGTREQLIAANIDALLVVAAAAEPAFSPGLIDRFLIAAQVGRVEPILVLNKMDLVDAEPEELAAYRALGVAVYPVSCETGQGLEELRAALRGKRSVLAGHSGVGKSTLLNTLDPNLRLLTQEVSGYSARGKHTTTGARLYELAGDTHVIDTPGIRALGLWGVSPEEVSYYFPDLAQAAQHCKFRDCTHTHEPECGVLAAIESGGISRFRYDSYLRIRGSLEDIRGNTPGQTSLRRWS